jgi:secondary thiamine-phosphate synthase enzyme
MIEIETRERVQIIDITPEVQKEIRHEIKAEVDFQSGVAVVYTPHTTTAVIVNEGERGLLEDILDLITKLVPERAGYKHDRIDNNADAHLRACLLGNSVVIPVENGMLSLGTWQRILFIEFDGPRRRRVFVKLV